MKRKPLLFPPEKIQAVHDADKEIEEIVRQRKLGTPEHHEVARRFHEAIAAVWPDEFWDALQPPYDDPEKLDVLLRFLEEDPFFFRSGYMKEKALGRLGKFVLTPSDRRRIAAIVLRAVDTVNRREFGDQAGAARHADFEALGPGLIERMTLPVDRRSWQAYQAARSAGSSTSGCRSQIARRRRSSRCVSALPDSDFKNPSLASDSLKR